MKCVQILLLGALALSVTACTNEETPPVAPPPTPGGSGHQTHPDLYKKNAVWGSITSGGQPLAGATITVVKQNEQLPIEDSGEYALQLPADEYGAPPHELRFSKSGYQPQTHSVTITEAGVELNVDLKPE